MLGTKHKYLLVLYDEEGNWQDFEKFMDKFSDPVPCKRGSKRAARPPIISEVFGTRVTRTNTDDEEVTDVFFVLTMRGKDQMLEGMMASMFPDKFRGDHYTISKELVSDAVEHAIKYQGTGKGCLPPAHELSHLEGCYRITADGMGWPMPPGKAAAAEIERGLKRGALRLLMRVDNEGQVVAKIVPEYMQTRQYWHYVYWGAREKAGVQPAKAQRGGQKVWLPHFTPVDVNKVAMSLNLSTDDLFFWGYP
mmetsp:Transcript_17365/g.43624  ORF Transcript_17365/g.43624 Transcript_17365/m.43624 type:complete len:250 (-) Transcript_17365:76-825(-)